MRLGALISSAWFRWVHGHHLVYNACWEDPRLDRQALTLGPQHRVAVITSAGCNALEYALQGPRRVDAIDVNFRQNALLELKIAGIKRLDFDRFFELFGEGYSALARSTYRQELRPALSPAAQRFWDRHIGWFAAPAPRRSFYYFGTTGLVAWIVNHYIDRIARIRPDIDHLLSATTLVEQQRIYAALHQAFFSGLMKWIVGRDATLALLGVPQAQRRQVEMHYPGGIARFIEDRITAVFTKLPLCDNYFWRLYLTGRYTRECCPEYLKRENFQKLKDGLIDRVHVFTGPLLEFLERSRGPIDRFVLLDHMDWLSVYCVPQLRRQWQSLIERAAPGARFLWRSGGLQVDYVDPLRINYHGQVRRLGNLLTYQQDLADRLHTQDRVHTYGSYYIADLAKE